MCQYLLDPGALNAGVDGDSDCLGTLPRAKLATERQLRSNCYLEWTHGVARRIVVEYRGNYAHYVYLAGLGLNLPLREHSGGLVNSTAISPCDAHGICATVCWLSLMNALSIPTWMVHVSSVIEWLTAIILVTRFAAKPGYAHWRALAWGMLPALISAMCACTWHFLDNLPRLDWLVTLQALTTVIGNVTLCIAAWWIWRQSKSTGDAESFGNQ